MAALAGDLVLTWDSVAGWPTLGDFPIRIDNPALSVSEYVLCTSVNVGANQTTVVRAQEGTGASAFAINSTGGNDLTAQMMTDAFVRLDTAASQTLTGPLVIPPAIGVAAAATSYGSMPIKIVENLLAGIAATVTFSSIPTGFRHIAFDWLARGDAVVTSSNLLAQLNGDTAANYDIILLQGSSAVTAFESLGQVAGFFGTIPAASATANYFGQGEAKIRYYQSLTSDKIMESSYAFWSANTTGTGVTARGGSKWRTTNAAVNAILVKPTSGNFIAGSLFRMVGEP